MMKDNFETIECIFAIVLYIRMHCYIVIYDLLFSLKHNEMVNKSKFRGNSRKVFKQQSN